MSDYSCTGCENENKCKLSYEKTDCYIEELILYNNNKNNLEMAKNKLNEAIKIIDDNNLRDEFYDFVRNIEFTKDLLTYNDEDIKYAIESKYGV